MLQLAAAVAFSLFLVGAAKADLETGDMTTAQKCNALRQLNAEYQGSSLSIAEKAIKAQMVAWYKVNCSIKRRARTK